MSQNHGGRLARQSTSDKPGRPSLDRPSLFAGMDNEDSTFGGDTQRVRILSTLESSRRPSGRKGPTKIQGITRKKRSNWQTKALLGLMGVGVLTLLTSFVMVVAEGHGPSAKPDTASKPSPTAPAGKQSNAPTPKVAADASNPLAALIAQPARPTPPASAPQAAIIENVAQAATTSMAADPKTNKTVALAAAAPLQSAPVLAPKSASPSAPGPNAAAVNAKPSVTSVALAQPSPSPNTAAAEAARNSASAPVKPGATPTLPTGKRPTSNKGKDDDVALLEAMFAHTRPRPAATSVADELKQRCGSLNGAEAATCRARVCVQNPTAAACHQD